MSSNLYDRLSRCLRIVERHNGAMIEEIYAYSYRARIPETHEYQIKDLFMKLVNDGMIYVSERGRIYVTPTEMITKKGKEGSE